MCLASVVKKFEFWQPRLGGKPPILALPNFGQILFISYICLPQTLHVSSLKG